MKKIPYGISDYKKIVENGYYYVDKTMFLEKLESVGDTFVYLRPRRFGKTLLTSMMYYYYDVNSSNEFDTLFKDTYVYNNSTTNKNNYYVLKFDFSGMSNFDDINSIKNGFVERIYSGISIFLNHYGLDYNIYERKEPSEILDRFLIYFDSLHLDKKLYVIIDEYDNFTNSVLSKDVNIFKNILGNEGFVKAFYSIIKSNSGTIIDRVFITGVCSISLDAMTSGFNIATNITNHEYFNSLTAFTHEEVKTLIKDLDKKDREEIFDSLLVNYDGYRFTIEKDERVFNSTLVMYYLSTYFEVNHPPRELMDSNIISNYEQIKNIIKLGLDRILDDGRVVSRLKTNFNLISDYSESDIISLLYYFGYLTIDGLDDNNYTFKIPNRVIERIYGELYLSLYDFKYTDETEYNAINELKADGKIDKLCDYISTILKTADNRVYINFGEKNLQLFMYTLMKRYTQLDVEFEYHFDNKYADIVVLKNEKTKYNVIIELKYIKKKEYSRRVFEKVKNEAIEQVRNYKLDGVIETSIKRYAVIFVNDKYTLIEC